MGNLVKVEILGQELTLRTSADEGRVLEAAALVNAKAEEYQAATGANARFDLTVLAALDIANTYLEFKEKGVPDQGLRELIKDRTTELIRAIEAEVE